MPTVIVYPISIKQLLLRLLKILVGFAVQILVNDNLGSRFRKCVPTYQIIDQFVHYSRNLVVTDLNLVINNCIFFRLDSNIS